MRNQKFLYINLVPITEGGGLQNALSFISTLSDFTSDYSGVKLIFKDHKLLIDLCKKHNIPFETIKYGKLSRLFFELFRFVITKDAVIFTLFGGRPIVSRKNINIVGCAYSNLFYPEMDFWILETRKSKIKLWFVDKLRYYLTKTATATIFETSLLKDLAINRFSFNKDHTYHVPMAVSELVRSFVPSNVSTDSQTENKVFRILYLGNARPNKRQHLLPEIAQELVKINFTNFRFILTLNQCGYRNMVEQEIARLNVQEYFEVREHIPEELISDEINNCHAMINIAQLESFSNNFVEAWHMKKLLITTDSQWARCSANDGALYINPEMPTDSARMIAETLLCPEKRHEIIENGKKQLTCYPTPQEKTKKILEIVQTYRDIF